MKKTIFLVLALLCSTIAMADEYSDAVMRLYMLQNGDMAKDKVVSSLSSIAQKKGHSAEESKTLAAKFYDETLYPQMLEKVVNAYKGKVSLDELKQLQAAYDTEAGKTAVADLAKSASEENSQKLQSLFTPAIMKLVLGGTPSNISAPKDCPASYQTKFRKMAEVSNVTSMIDQLSSSIKETMSQNPEAKKIIDPLMKYMNDNASNLMLNIYYPTVTEADIDFLLSVYTSPAGQHVIDATKSVGGDIATYTMKVTMDWVKSL